MIVVLLFDLPDEIADEILKQDMHGEDLAAEINDAAIMHSIHAAEQINEAALIENCQHNAWHLSDKARQEIDAALDKIYFEYPGAKYK